MINSWGGGREPRFDATAVVFFFVGFFYVVQPFFLSFSLSVFIFDSIASTGGIKPAPPFITDR